MYYLELIQRFWDFNQRVLIGSTGISMYLYLLRIGNDKDCYHFQISDAAISRELGLSRNTIKSTKEKLKNLGLIQFQTKNGLSCHYRLIPSFPLQLSEPENIKKKEFKTEEFSQKIKNLGISSKTVSPIQYLPENTNQEDEIHSLQTIQLPVKQQRISSAIEIAHNIPSLEEFMEYAKTLENYEAQLDFEIQSKYENWKNNGWKNSSDRPITNWKSILKSTLPYMKNTTDKQELSLQSIPNIKRPKSQNDI